MAATMIRGLWMLYCTAKEVRNGRWANGREESGACGQCLATVIVVKVFQKRCRFAESASE